ncbi:hypothetical protein C8F04DRAFT_1139394 [Mycena alexandri]|uniref:Uncharacterized protein n=1 Tax=Mycena alexandri TaxID=1745969 RepID=A0AAD6WUX1_9AGAR|nr:hypothetical protein C8F04DRAFT_1139394 [Mycena alexandri]
MSLTPRNVEIDLPTELEREIFECAALLAPECMPKLLLVGRRVKIWIEPLMYRILSIHPLQQRTVIRRTLKGLLKAMQVKPLAFFRQHVRNVCFVRNDNAKDIWGVLSTCTGTVNLALFNADVDSTLLPALAKLRLQRLSAVLGDLFSTRSAPDFAHPLFANLTHLDVLDKRDGGWAGWVGLPTLPRLTHLSFNDDISNSVCEGALEHCTQLRVLVIVWANHTTMQADPYDRTALAEDPRFVMIVVNQYLRDWEAGAAGGEDYWARADAFVQKRQAGVVKGHLIRYLEEDHAAG